MIDPLARMIGRSPTDPQDIRRMAAAAYHQRGVVVLWLDDIRNDLDRQLVANVAERIYGKRTSPGANKEGMINGERRS